MLHQACYCKRNCKRRQTSIACRETYNSKHNPCCSKHPVPVLHGRGERRAKAFPCRQPAVGKKHHDVFRNNFSRYYAGEKLQARGKAACLEHDYHAGKVHDKCCHACRANSRIEHCLSLLLLVALCHQPVCKVCQGVSVMHASHYHESASDQKPYQQGMEEKRNSKCHGANYCANYCAGYRKQVHVPCNIVYVVVTPACRQYSQE